MSDGNDRTADITEPVNAMTDYQAPASQVSQVDEMLHAWAEGVDKQSGPNSTHLFRDKPIHPLPAAMLTILEDWDGETDDALVERSMLGEGGMAVVYLADQSLPPRQVAVKRLRENTMEEAKQLFAEALLTGTLEHPNIIPMYAIRLDPKRGPEVVLKRVEGVSLSEAYAAEGQTETGLQKLLPKLIQVCNALEYAHARKIYHRDIKAENIMLGQYGEVYLLDWGIAVDKKAEAPPNTGIVGTPHYIAPEMLSGEPDEVDARTDVYLLGATLHFLLVGKPRHDAPTSLGAAVLASESAPYAYPSSVFQELGNLANRACALNPDDRPESVADFRTAIEACLTHWDAMRTVKLAQEDFKFVTGIAAETAPLEVTAKRFDAAVLKLQFALSSWPGCQEAEIQLRRLRMAMTRHYLDANDAKAAYVLLAQITADSDKERLELDELTAAVNRASDRESQVYRHAAANDMTLSRTGRRRASFGMLAIVATAIAVAGYQQFNAPKARTAAEGLGIWLVGALLVVVVSFLNRKSILKNAAGKRAMLVLMFAPALITGIRVVAYVNDLNPVLIHPIETFAIAHICATAVEVFPRGPQFALFAVCLGVIGLVFQPFAYLAFVTALLIGCAGFVWQWLMREPDAQ